MSRPHANASTIRVFLVTGKPQGIRVIDRPGWTGVCVAFSRADYADVRRRAEVQRTGVYILVGPDAEDPRHTRIYVGEGDRVVTRLDGHQRDKDFWTEGYILTTSDESLDKAHVRYLEARFLEIARLADNAVLENGTAPTPPRLDEPRTADMESFLDRSLTLFPLVGVNVFDIVEQPEPGSAGDQVVADLEVEEPDGPLLHLRIAEAEARGRDDSRGFLVYKGAFARKVSNVMNTSYVQLRETMVQDGVLAPAEGDRFVLTRNFIFASPSAAASVLAGGSRNGRIDWKAEDGRTLKEMQEDSLEQTPISA
jgi:hypothetical protein